MAIIRNLLLPVAFAMISSSASAQYYINQNKTWIFGYGAGIDFNTGSPTPITSSIATGEGCASVSDASGNLLFYTDGFYVYNRFGVWMPSVPATGIVPFITASTTQGALITPVPSHPEQYYLFSLENYETEEPQTSRLYYSIVDMALDGGNGDIVTGMAAIPLDSFLSEKMTATAGNNCDIWVLVHSSDSAMFKAFNINSSGINPVPVISYSGFENGMDVYSVGAMKISPGRDRVILTTYFQLEGSAYSGGSELLDFDPSTGIVSNAISLDTGEEVWGYGCSFSPDGSKVYTYKFVPDSFAGVVSQYDVTLPAPAAVALSRQDIYWSVGVNFSSMEIGPDGKIYIPAWTGLDVIDNPNLSGSLCNYLPGAVPPLCFAPSYGLPNLFIGITPSDTSYASHDTIICFNAGDTILASAPAGFISYQWFDGKSGPTHPVYTTGEMWVYCYDSFCSLLIDTIHIKPQVSDTLFFSHDTVLCGTSGLPLIAPPGYTTYQWSTGSTASSIVAGPGNFCVISSKSCEIRLDSFKISLPDTASYRHDTVYCAPVETITLSAPAGYPLYNWNTGISGPVIMVPSAGFYWVSMPYGCNLRTDTFSVAEINTDVMLAMQTLHDTTVCADQFEGIGLEAILPNPVSSIMWSTGDTTPVIVVESEGTYSFVIMEHGCAISDSMNLQLVSCSCWLTMPAAFSPNNDGKNDVYMPLIEPGCEVRNYHLRIFNRWGQQVFSSFDPSKGWDGMLNGMPQGLETFQYLIEFDGTPYRKHYSQAGDFVLIR